MTPTAIVTDALWRKSVAAIRSLGAAGYRVFALGDSRLTTGFHSRYTTRTFLGPVAADDPEAFGAVLARAIDAASGEPVAVLPMEDATCEWFLDHGSSLPRNVHWLLPTAEAFAVARDKGRTAVVAESMGLHCPKTRAPQSAAELRSLIAAGTVDDLIIKPRTGSGSGGILYGTAIRDTPLEAHWETFGPLLLQERIRSDGTAIGVSVLFDGDGRERAAFAHRRLREYPASGGPSTQRESVALDELHAHSRRLLEALEWRGVAMVEWKIEPGSGQPMLLEINPRFWGSLALALRAGVDFPALYGDASLGRSLPESLPPYRPGVRCRWMIPGDVLRYAGERRDRREPLREFLRGAVKESEEFDRRDIRGSLGCVLCPALLAANPKYWRYVRRL